MSDILDADGAERTSSTPRTHMASTERLTRVLAKGICIVMSDQVSGVITYATVSPRFLHTQHADVASFVAITMSTLFAHDNTNRLRGSRVKSLESATLNARCQTQHMAHKEG